MKGFALAHVNVAAGARSSDAAFSQYSGDRLILVIADGAGGTTRGFEAAHAVTTLSAHELAHGSPLSEAAQFAHVLHSIDIRLTREGGGQTTAVCVSITDDAIIGASVGDSEAWVVDEEITRLTEHQSRKPLIGDGARVTPFALGRPLNGTLIVASDGLFSYVRADAISTACRLATVEAVADALVTAARLPSGKLPDDLAMFVVRPR